MAGKRYFQTKDKHGVFIRPTKLEPETSTPSTPKLSRVGSSVSEMPLSPTEKSLKGIGLIICMFKGGPVCIWAKKIGFGLIGYLCS